MLKELGLYLSIAVAAVAGSYLYSHYVNQDIEIVATGNYEMYGVTNDTPIVIYTAQWCDACKSLKALLNKLNIDYQNVDLDGSPERHSSLQAVGIKVIPVIFIKDTMIKGFNESLITTTIAEKGLTP